jgi:hypothetical protein
MDTRMPGDRDSNPRKYAKNKTSNLGSKTVLFLMDDIDEIFYVVLGKSLFRNIVGIGMASPGLSGFALTKRSTFINLVRSFK